MAVTEDCRRLVVAGRVQGVGFRAWASETALRLGLRGWARNLADGQVEIVAAGEPHALEEMIAACRMGPLGSRVSGVTAFPHSDPDLPRSFQIEPSRS